MSIKKTICTAILFSFLLGNYNIDLGFALKPFMIVGLFLVLILFADKIQTIQLSYFDYAFFTLSIYGGITVLFSQDIYAGLRLFVLSQLVLICYVTTSAFFSKLKFSISDINQSIVITGFLFNFISLSLYFYGLYVVSGDMSSYMGEDVYGLTIDRGLPRMIGLTFDPNFFVMFNIVFYFFLAFKDRTMFEDITLLLIIISIIFSLSRGGILAIALPTIYKFMQSFLKLRLSKKALGIGALIIILIASIIFYIGDFINVIFQSRLSGITSGSGRTSLINTLLTLIYSNPIFGVGWHNFRYYNQQMTGEYHYGHNTFLELFAELGVIGFTIYLIFLFFVYRKVTMLANLDLRFTYLKYSFWAFLISMFFLSSIVNEVFFLYLIIIKTYYSSYFYDSRKFF